MNGNGADGDIERTTVMKLKTSTRARLQIAKNRLRLGNANDTLVYLLDFWEKRNGGCGGSGMHS